MGEKRLTDASDGSTEMSQHRRTSITAEFQVRNGNGVQGSEQSPHFALDRHLGFKVNISEIHTEPRNQDTRKEEYWCEHDWSRKLNYHVECQFHNTREILSNRSVDGGNVLSASSDDTTRRCFVQPSMEQLTYK